jgi:hypothetical protein
VLEKRELRSLFGSKREEVAEDWRRLHSEKLQIFYASRNIIRVIKLMSMRWVEHVARMIEMRNA